MSIPKVHGGYNYNRRPSWATIQTIENMTRLPYGLFSNFLVRTIFKYSVEKFPMEIVFP